VAVNKAMKIALRAYDMVFLLDGKAESRHSYRVVNLTPKLGAPGWTPGAHLHS
jgi:hypothetical protein